MSEKDEKQPERTEKHRPVVFYLLILFIAAFLLLLMSYLMQQRANREAISNLQQTSNSAAESLQNLNDERDALKEENDALTAENGKLTDDLAQARREAEEQESNTAARLRALEQLNTLRALYNQRRYSEARALLTTWEAEAPGALAENLKAASEALSQEEREIYDPLEAYKSLTQWLS